MSIVMKAATLALRLRAKTLASEASTVKALASRPTDAPVPARLERVCDVERYDVDGMPVITLRPKQGPTPIHLLYLHGGAYVMPLVKPHWSIIGELIRRTGASVTVPLYALAPEHKAEETFPKVRRLFERLAKEGNPVTIAGDSAGGGLSVSVALQLRDAGGPRPAALVLFAPWLDVTLTNPKIPKVEPRDPMLSAVGAAWCGVQWAGKLSLGDPRISPLHDSLVDLPRTVIYHGGADILLPDAELFANKAQKAGSNVQLFVYPDAFHVFVGIPFLPESRMALADAAKVISATQR
ncbi:alpha/beta hydrolase fold domain-containing protein [Burkholderia anthina]|uniref:alpha/beta hydrolase fold domain-containing protein n=1 Tax=Burkholderia anthina TaxID=179879 RepID=UPI00158A1887|nr:alpha/beta hydrolase [Burkholderia anthina]